MSIQVQSERVNPLTPEQIKQYHDDGYIIIKKGQEKLRSHVGENSHHACVQELAFDPGQHDLLVRYFANILGGSKIEDYSHWFHQSNRLAHPRTRRSPRV